MVYRGDVHRGEHEPVLDSVLFLAVQDKLAVQAVARRCRLRGSSALLTGRIFDACGNRMSPTHANKGGVRYRYYASQAVLQKKPRVPISVSRVPAAELETLVLAALRNHLNTSGSSQQLPDSDRDLVERHLERVTLNPERDQASPAGDRRKILMPTTVQTTRHGVPSRASRPSPSSSILDAPSKHPQRARGELHLVLALGKRCRGEGAH